MENRPRKRPFPFTIENIIAMPNEKRARRFFIENLLHRQSKQIEGEQLSQQGRGEEGQESSSATTDKRPEDYIKMLSDDVQHNNKFRCMQSKASYSIQDVPIDAGGFVASILQHCVEKALATSRERGVNADHLGCVISSPLLTRGDIWHPIRPITADTVPSLLERFNEVANSKEQEGVTLWGEPFTITVTTIDKKGLPTQKKLPGGARQRNIAPVNHRINLRSLIEINNPDDKNYCLFYAMQATLKYAVAGFTKKQFFNYKHSLFGQRGRMECEVKLLMKAIRAPADQPEYEATVWAPRIIDLWNNIVYAGQHRFKLFIFGKLGNYKPELKYGPDDYDTSIILYYDKDAKHFHGVQKGGNLFGKPYCFSCQVPYERDERHRKSCKARCKKCSRIGPSFPCKPTPDYKHKCTLCNKTFFNEECHQQHIANGYCAKNKECPKCGWNYDIDVHTRNGREGHVCGERYCENCDCYHDPKRGCFIRPLQPLKSQQHKLWRLVAFDMETMQHSRADPTDPTNKKRVHEPNFIAAKVACPECIESGKWKKSLRGEHCAICGANRTITFSHQPFKKTSVDKQVITRHPLVEFVKWILYKLPKEYETVAYSHYGGRFDMVLAFRELFIEGFNPELIRKGNRLYMMNVKKDKTKGNGKLEFRDSWNLIPTPLAGMVPMFELDVEDKPFFPHLANKPDNYECLIFPSKEDYLAGGMMPEKRKEFDRWYAKTEMNHFCSMKRWRVIAQANKNFSSYCTNDVEILLEGLVAFRGEFLEMTKRAAGPDGKADRACYQTPHDGIDAVRECCTIAGACMKHFCTNHLKPGHLGLVPENGYDTLGQRQSDLAFKFLDWYAWKNRVKIQTGLSEEGEKKVGNYSLDGWIEEEQKGIEVHGCFWHACPKCYPDPDNTQFLNKIGVTADRIRERDRIRMETIKKEVPNVEVFWECEINRMKETDKSMRLRFDQYDPEDRGTLDLRSCFMGGRTGAWKLYHEAGPDEEISYYDFTSLYPYINYMTDYPLQHPKLHAIYEPVDWRKPEDNPYPLALLKVFVVPPRHIDVPVLPVRVNQRLCFPTCMTCCKAFPDGAVMQNYSCTHTDQERGWVSSCTSLELEAALENGYRVTELLRVLEYKKSDNTLFRPYIREFYREKMHSSGFDETIRGNEEAEEQFMRESVEMFDIQIDRNKIKPNKGRRALSKLMLNNLWGRFSLRNYGLSKTVITDEPCVLREHLDNGTIEVTAVDFLTPDTVLISYLTKREWVEEHKCSNVVVSLFTTSAARLLLLKSMQDVVKTPGCTLLYTDTDSLIFAHPKGKNPLKLGPHLGQFTDEYPNHRIVEFCSGGSKQYGLKLKRKDAQVDDDVFEYLLKVRGITLNHDVTVNQGLRYELFKKIVLKFGRTGEVDTISLIYPNFLYPSVLKGSVFSAPLEKIYKPYVGNGVVCPQTLNVLPFGHFVPKH